MDDRTKWGAAAWRTCDDPFHKPAFDRAALAGLSAKEIRQRWPRSSGTCPSCGYYGVVYASYEHYIAGDW